MFSKRRFVQTVTLLVLCLMAMSVYAAEETIVGLVRNVNTETGVFSLSAEDGGLLELRAPAAFLAHLQAGDVVQVRLSGTRVIDISKQHELQPPSRNGQRQQQPPADERGRSR